MSVKSLIEKKRDGGAHSAMELDGLMKALLDGSAKDYQIAAWLMAVFLRGMTDDETVALVEAMWRSGRSFPRPHRSGFWIDKHSTGGVGDKTSLLLVPLVSGLCERLAGKDEVKIPMISGRALGLSGGTLDKLESVPGFRTGLTVEEAEALLRRQGFFMMGQTADIAPADRIIYSLRDATSTVNSIPLVVSSILSKKLSESLDGLVLDVKCGSGAFFPEVEKARQLGKTLIQVAQKLGVRATGLVTRVDEPLGCAVGNFLEMEECAAFLAGEGREASLNEVTLRLAQQMVEMATGGKFSASDIQTELELEISSQRALNLYVQMLEAQGGRWDDFLQQRERWQKERVTYRYHAPTSGHLAQMDARQIARVLEAIGGVRPHKEASLDPMVGVWVHHKVGEAVTAGTVLLEVHMRNDAATAKVEALCQSAVTITPTPVPRPSWIVEVLS